MNKPSTAASSSGQELWEGTGTGAQTLQNQPGAAANRVGLCGGAEGVHRSAHSLGNCWDAELCRGIPFSHLSEQSQFTWVLSGCGGEMKRS